MVTNLEQLKYVVNGNLNKDNFSKDYTKYKSVITGTSNSVNYTAGATQYVSTVAFHGHAYAIAIPCAGTIRNLQVYLGTAPGVGKSVVCTIMADNADTAVTTTLTGNVTNETHDRVNSVHIAQGQRICLKIVSTAGSTVGEVVWAVEFTAD
jgi:hypothetical protein